MRFIILVGSLLTLTSAAQAGTLTIIAGDHNLLPNTAGQKVQIFVVNDMPDSTEGLLLNAQLGDGGPALGGVDITPLVTVDTVGPGTLFEFNHNPVYDASVPPSFAHNAFATERATVPIPVGSSLLATLTFDTTRFDSAFAQWPLLLSGTLNGDTQIFRTEGQLFIENGSIGWVPEPSSFVLAAFGLIGLVVWRRRKQ